jgi:hypothetical protein
MLALKEIQSIAKEEAAPIPHSLNIEDKQMNF